MLLSRYFPMHCFCLFSQQISDICSIILCQSLLLCLECNGVEYCSCSKEVLATGQIENISHTFSKRMMKILAFQKKLRRHEPSPQLGWGSLVKEILYNCGRNSRVCGQALPGYEGRHMVLMSELKGVKRWVRQERSKSGTEPRQQLLWSLGGWHIFRFVVSKEVGYCLERIHCRPSEVTVSARLQA